MTVKIYAKYIVQGTTTAGKSIVLSITNNKKDAVNIANMYQDAAYRIPICVVEVLRPEQGYEVAKEQITYVDVEKEEVRINGKRYRI